MPTKNPRVMVSLEPGLHQWLTKTADKQGLSVSGLIRDLIKDAYSETEDFLWAREGEERLKTLGRRKPVSHSDAWK